MVCLVQLSLLFSFLWLDISSALSFGGKPNSLIKPYRAVPLQDIVTWDAHSIFVRGERILFYSGEFHPFRLPSPGLWLDVFQKIRALGYSGVSFYVDWSLIEGNPGHVSFDGVFALEPFFEAATEAGIYLLARPGPYINSELSGGGLPGWLQRIKAPIRTATQEFLNATEKYVETVGSIIAKAQITNGGPVILFQPENEYTFTVGSPNLLESSKFLDPEYMAYVEDQYRQAGITVPFIGNDAFPLGNWAPGKGKGSVDIYGHDGYPFYVSCARPSDWTQGNLPTPMYNYTTHLMHSPTTPYSIIEFQGGAPDPWGGTGFDQCAAFINAEFERVMYKNMFGFSVTIFNLYMTYGGTNWGNMGHPLGYTSYDHGAAVKEDRTIVREKYSEAKLEAHFLQASPAYLTAIPGDPTYGTYAQNVDVAVTLLSGTKTQFYVVRHTDFRSTNSTKYQLSVPTSIGNVTIPQTGGSLTLYGRDSKIHVVDYNVGGVNLIYSSAEIYTWKRSGNKSVLLLYGGERETHEFALSSELGKPSVEGNGVKITQKGSATIVQWTVTPSRKVLHYGQSLDVYLLWRNDAYNYWVIDLPTPSPMGNYTSFSKANSSIIAKAGYLLRSAAVSGTTLYLTGDLNATTELQVLVGAPQGSSIFFNGKPLSNIKYEAGRLVASLDYKAPTFKLPNLSSLDWKYLDSLPEINSYDDSSWTECTHRTSNNPRNLTTPTSLYGGDYGFHAGSLIYRGHFTATGHERTFNLSTQGGFAIGHTVWLNKTFLGSWPGIDAYENYNQTFNLPSLIGGGRYVLTVVMDHMGMNMEFIVGSNTMKAPRGILDYSLEGHVKSDVVWKMTGNLGGEQYRDLVRGPLNEGAMYAERQGYHLTDPPSSKWKSSSPFEGITTAGIGFYSTHFDLKVPQGYDIPMAFVFKNSTVTGTGNGTTSNFRCQLYVNGYQFGKYVNNIGPQTSYPVPEGVLNHNGSNTVALTLWAFDTAGAKLASLDLVAQQVVQSGYKKPALSPQPRWKKRDGAY